ncbi:3-(3-hydroxyphenyl)propionate hydroxylase [Mycolicibacterium sp. (ex Dasyatis americana)]|nr:3-(3-hydroxyphenyl)propionate hydroxylase [Mycolicibacterium sp. (ex Dasyatis americana)]
MTSVVIVGAGPTGIVAATLFARYHVDCLVLDRWPEVYRQPRAVHLDDEIYRILADLGLAEQFAAISRPAAGLQLLDADLKVLARFTREPVGRHGFPQANMFDQPQLEELLRANLARYPQLRLRTNVEVTGFTRLGQGRLQVAFVDRTTGATEHVEADYLLGCDGANSMVRRRLGVAMTDMHFEQRWLVADVRSTVDLKQWDGVHQVCTPARAATYMRIGNDRYRWEFRLLPNESVADYSTLETLRPLIAPWVGSCADLELVRVAEYTFRAAIAGRWRVGNVFLLGDAAHLTPPFIGQGMGAGVRDAVNLCWKLAAVIAGDLPEHILDSYPQERKPHARALIRVALAMGWAMTAGGGFGDTVRRAVLPRLGRIPALRLRLFDGVTPALRNSALVHRPRGRRSLAGTLCPNTVQSEGFTFVTTTPLPPAVHGELTERGTTVLVVDPDSELGRWLRTRRAKAAIIRPDRTVMRSGTNVVGLSELVPSSAGLVSCPSRAGRPSRRRGR